MPVLPHHRSKLRIPTEISLLGKGRSPAVGGACSHCHRTPLVGEHVHVYGDRLVCQLCRHLRREPPGETLAHLRPDRFDTGNLAYESAVV